MELSQILEGTEAPVVTDPVTPEVKEPRDDKGRFAKGETETETPTVETDKEPLDPKAKAFYAKAQDERRKRQEAERERDELRRLQQSTPPPDVLENPQGYAQHLEQQLRLTNLNDRLNLSEEMARDKFGEEAITEAQELFTQAAQSDPTLAHKLVTERHPYGWLIKWAKNRKFANEMGDDPDAFLSKKEAEWKAKYEAELSKRPSASVPPPSLGSMPSASVRADAPWSGPASLSSILKR